MRTTGLRTDGMDAILGGIADGDVRLLLVEGPTGSGKTRQLEYLLSWGRSLNYPVMLARCSRNERDVTFSVVHQLLESVSGNDDAANGLRPSIGEPAATRQELFRSWP